MRAHGTTRICVKLEQQALDVKCITVPDPHSLSIFLKLLLRFSVWLRGSVCSIKRCERWPHHCHSHSTLTTTTGTNTTVCRHLNSINVNRTPLDRLSSPLSRRYHVLQPISLILFTVIRYYWVKTYLLGEIGGGGGLKTICVRYVN